MTSKNKKKIITFLSTLLIITILAPSFLFSKPKKVEAGFPTIDFITNLFTGSTAGNTGATAVATNTTLAIKIKETAEKVLRQVIMTVQKRLLAEMTKSMVNWINSGFHGAPLFLENPESFFKNIGKYEIKNFITITGYDSNRFPFGKDFALNVIGSYKRTFEDNAQYTLSKVINDPALLQRYRTDFNFGGWNGFLTNTMYPQNNYIGYQMLATEELTRKLEGTVQNNVNKVKTVLDQGMGFLSPEKCADNGGNNDYNKVVANQFQRPTFKPSKYEWKAPAYQKLGKCTLLAIGFTTPQVFNTTEGVCKDKGGSWVTDYSTWQNESEGDYSQRYDEEKAKYDAEYNSKVAQEKTDWAEKNTCKNLVATTPGSIVADQIMGSLNSGREQTQLAAALGNSMSAIFDALLNKFIGSGLNALATKINPRAVSDDFVYEGQTLGSPVEGTNNNWDAGPDEEVSLDAFKKQLDGKTVLYNTEGAVSRELIGKQGTGTYIPGDIENTKKEIALLDNIDTDEKKIGIIQWIGRTWPEIRALDMCIPGPNINWQDRLLKEMDRNSSKLQEKSNDQDGEKAAASQLIYNDLQFAVKSFREWINNKMLFSLPGAISYMDAVDDIDSLYQQSEQVTNARRAKSQALARLEAIKIDLDKITTQPEPGTDGEKVLIAIRKKYNPIRGDVSNNISIENAENDLKTAQNKFYNMVALVTKCRTDRVAAGWNIDGGPKSTFTPKNTLDTSIANKAGTEQEKFCDIPIKNGYAHGAFQYNASSSFFVGGRNNTTVPTQDKIDIEYKDLPLVNGQDLLRYTKKLIAFFTFGLGGQRTVSMQLSCDIIYNSSIPDYKKDLPGFTSIIEPEIIIDDMDDGTGICSIPDDTIDSEGNRGTITIIKSEEACKEVNGTWTKN